MSGRNPPHPPPHKVSALCAINKSLATARDRTSYRAEALIGSKVASEYDAFSLRWPRPQI